MIYPVVPFPVTLSGFWLRFQGHGFKPIDALTQLTRDQFAIAKFLCKDVVLPTYIFIILLKLAQAGLVKLYRI